MIGNRISRPKVIALLEEGQNQLPMIMGGWFF